MRVIAGLAKGTQLETPKDGSVRPTSDRAREALFSILMPQLPGSRFLDLYAGTGANGIEALSRGAARATFIDESPNALALINRNLAKTKLAASAYVTRGHLPKDIRRAAGSLAPYDIIFADPPYAALDVMALLAAIRSTNVLAEEGTVVIEHASGLALDESMYAPMRLVKTARYGSSSLSFFA